MKKMIFACVILLLSADFLNAEEFNRVYIDTINLQRYPTVQFYAIIKDFHEQETTAEYEKCPFFHSNYWVRDKCRPYIRIQENGRSALQQRYKVERILNKNNVILSVEFESRFPRATNRVLEVDTGFNADNWYYYRGVESDVIPTTYYQIVGLYYEDVFYVERPMTLNTAVAESPVFEGVGKSSWTVAQVESEETVFIDKVKLGEKITTLPMGSSVEFIKNFQGDPVERDCKNQPFLGCVDWNENWINIDFMHNGKKMNGYTALSNFSIEDYLPNYKEMPLTLFANVLEVLPRGDLEEAEDGSLILKRQEIENKEFVIKYDPVKKNKALSVYSNGNLVSSFESSFSSRTEFSKFVKIDNCESGVELYRFVTVEPKWFVINYWSPQQNVRYFYAKNQKNKSFPSKNLKQVTPISTCVEKDYNSIRSKPNVELVMGL